MDAIDIQMMTATPGKVEKSAGAKTGPAANGAGFDLVLAGLNNGNANQSGNAPVVAPTLLVQPGAVQASFSLTPELQMAIAAARAAQGGQAVDANSTGSLAKTAIDAAQANRAAGKLAVMPDLALPDAAESANPDVVALAATAGQPAPLLSQIGGLSPANENDATQAAPKDNVLPQPLQDFLAALTSIGIALTPVKNSPVNEPAASDVGGTNPGGQNIGGKDTPMAGPRIMPGLAVTSDATPAPQPDAAGQTVADDQARSGPGAASDGAAATKFIDILQPATVAELNPMARQAVERLTRAGRQAARSGQQAVGETDGKIASTPSVAKETVKSPLAASGDVGGFQPAMTQTDGGQTPLQSQGQSVGAVPGSPATPNSSPDAAAMANGPRLGYVPPGQQVAVQVGRAIQAGSNKFQIQLNPAELGHVSVHLDVRDDGSVSLMVSAANADTLDMLRHDQHGLEKAMQDAGFKTPEGSLSFSLQGGDSQQRQPLWHEAQNDANGRRASDPASLLGSDEELAMTQTQQIRLSSHAGALDIQA